LTVFFDTNVLISHASNDSGMSFAKSAVICRYLVAYKVKMAVLDYQTSLGVLDQTLFFRGLPRKSNTFRRVVSGYFDPKDDLWPIAERCFAAYRTLENLSDEDWDAIEPTLRDEIVMLHYLCAIKPEGR